MSNNILDLRNELDNLRKMYEERGPRYTALIGSRPGEGKTFAICEGAPKPLLVYMFDPSGIATIQANFSDEIGKTIMIHEFTDDGPKNPKAYREFDIAYRKHIRQGYPKVFKSVVVDSWTVFQMAISNYIHEVSPSSKKLDLGGIAKADYKLIYATVEDILKNLIGAYQYVFLTIHIEPVKDEITGEILMEYAAYKGLKTDIPALFGDKLVLVNESGKRKFYLDNQRLYRAASTALPKLGGKVDANLRTIMEAGGFDIKDETIQARLSKLEKEAE